MVQVDEFKKVSNHRLDVKTVKELPADKRTAVILPEAEIVEFTNTDKEGKSYVEKKPAISVDLNGTVYEWVLNKTSVSRLCEELNSSDTDDWTGSVIKFLIDKNGDYEFITATLISSPTQKEA